MTLDEFVKCLRASVDEFDANWRERNAKDGSDYPMQMGEGDWWEQFMAYESLQGRERG